MKGVSGIYEGNMCKYMQTTNPLQERRCGTRSFSILLKQLVKFCDEFYNDIV